MDMTIDEFCTKHNACAPGHQWALKHCTSMQHAWDTTTRRDWLTWIATRDSVLTKRDLQWIAFRCAKLVEHLMPAKNKQALSVVECWLLGLMNDTELHRAKQAAAAYDATATATAAADAAADAAAVAYAAAYADAAAYATADAAAYAAAAAAAAAHAAYTAYDAADAEADKQIMAIIREYKPNFSHATC